MKQLFFLPFQLYGDKTDVKLTTVHPFTVNTGLAQKPLTRFSSLIPITEPDEAARIIVEAVRRNEEYVFVPRRLASFFASAHVVPFKVKLALMDFLGCGVDAHE